MKKNINNLLSYDEIIELFDYDPINGNLIRKITTNHRAKKGDIAGTLHSCGRIVIGTKGKKFYAHRLIWLHQTGSWPENDIDHIDGNPINNKIENLRNATDSQNQQNIKKPKSSNLHGFLGVESRKVGWVARIMSNGKRLNLGTFKTPEEAHAAYISAKRVLHSFNTL
jgi:hypothetical protein